MWFLMFTIGYLLYVGAWKYPARWARERREEREYREHLAEVRRRNRLK